MSGLDGLADLARQRWREDAACGKGARDEFVDVSPGWAEYLINRWCHRCTVVGHCREQGDAEKHKFPTVMGATYYAARKQYRASA